MWDFGKIIGRCQFPKPVAPHLTYVVVLVMQILSLLVACYISGVLSVSIIMVSPVHFKDVRILPHAFKRFSTLAKNIFIGI
jgi:hypothetical protein